MKTGRHNIYTPHFELWVLSFPPALSSHVCNVPIIQALRDEVEQYQRAYEDLQTLVTHGPKNLSLAQSRVSWSWGVCDM